MDFQIVIQVMIVNVMIMRALDLLEKIQVGGEVQFWTNFHNFVLLSYNFCGGHFHW